MKILLCDGFTGPAQRPGGRPTVTEVPDDLEVFRTREMIPHKWGNDPRQVIDWFETRWVPNGKITDEGVHVFVPDYLLQETK